MKRDKMVISILLAISVALFVPIWGTFHYMVGVQKGWIAFLSAAVFFAAGHKLGESINVTLSHLVGVGWGLAVLYLWDRPILEINDTIYTFLILAIFGFMSAIVTNVGLRFLSHTPSLFCGWAIAFVVFGGVPVTNWTGDAIGEVLLGCVIGVLFVGVGIAQFHSVLVKLVMKSPTKPEKLEATTTEANDKSVAIAKVKNAADGKMEQYLQVYSNPDAEAADDKREMQDLRTEISKLHQLLMDAPTFTAASGSTANAHVKIVGVCGSPHKKGSTVEYLRKALEAAAEMGNVEVELIELAGKEIKPCLGCKSDRCGGTCIISDYMQELYPKLRECDGLILASPSYFGTFSGELKLFIDRLRVMRHSNFELGNVVVGTLAVAGRRHGGQEITNLDLIQSMMRHNTIIVNDGTAVCQLGATGWSHTFDDPTKKADTDDYGMETAVGVGKRVAEIAKVIKASGLQNTVYKYNQEIGKR